MKNPGDYSLKKKEIKNQIQKNKKLNLNNNLNNS